MPLYAQQLGAPDSLLGLVTGFPTLAALLIRPFIGALLDRFGRKGIFLVGLVMMVTVSFSYAFFPFVIALLAIRLLHGFGWGVASTATNTIASDIVPRKRFGEGIGYFSLSGSLALAVAPGLGIELFHLMGFKSISYIATAILIIALLLAMMVSYKKGVKPEPGAKRAKLIERAAVLPSAIMFFITATYGAVVTFIAIHSLEQGVQNIGLFFTVYAIALIISRPTCGRLVDRRGSAFAIVPGLLMLSSGLVLIAFSHSLWMLLISAICYGFGFGATQSGLQTIAVTEAPFERSGAANATFFVGFDAGIGFGSIISGTIATAVGYGSMFLFYAIFPVIATLVFFLVRKNFTH